MYKEILDVEIITKVDEKQTLNRGQREKNDKDFQKFQKFDDRQTLKLFGTEKNAQNVAIILKNTLASYFFRPKNQTLQEWVEAELRKYPNEFKDENEIQNGTNELIDTISTFNKNRTELQQSLDKGNSTESWMAKKIEESAKINNIHNIAQYGQKVDDALKSVNDDFKKYSNYDEQHPTHGLVAEDMDNLQDSVRNNEVIHEGTNNAKNGPDRIVNGQEIQTKYYETAKGSVGSAFKNNKYRYVDKNGKPMQLEVPSDQYDEAIQVMKNHIDLGHVDGVSDPAKAKEIIKKGAITYKESKKIARKLKKDKNLKEVNWDKLSKRDIVTSVVKETGKSILANSAIQGGRRLGRRIWNSLTGEVNKPLSEEITEWMNDSFDSAKSQGIQTAISTGTAIAVRKGWIPGLAKDTPFGKIASIATVGIENSKILYKMAKGDIGFKEGLGELTTVTSSTLGGLTGAGEGGTFGATLGSAFGPMGTAIGGFVGATLGGIAGSGVGELVAEGAKIVGNYASDAWDSITSWF